jgi:hypothetical protein
MFLIDHLYSQDTMTLEGTRNLVRWTKNLAPVVALPMRYSRRHVAGEPIRREFFVSNDSFRKMKGLFAWQLLEDGRVVHEGQMPVELAAGTCKTLAIEMPAVSAGPDVRRLTLRYDVVQGDDMLYSDSIRLAIMPRPEWKEVAGVTLLDPKGNTAKLLAAGGLTVRCVQSLTDAGDGPLIVDSSAKLTAEDWKSLEKRVAAGARVLILRRRDWPKTFCNVPLESAEKNNSYGFPVTPKNGQPYWFNPKAGFAATYAFIRSPGHPVLAGLADEDLRCWAGKSNFTMPMMAEGIRWPAENVVALDNLRKPAGDGLFRCLLESGSEAGLEGAPMIEIRFGSGTALATSMLMAEKLADEPAAGRLLWNCLQYLSRSKGQPIRPLAALSPAPELQARKLVVVTAAPLDTSAIGAAVLEAQRADWAALAKREKEIRDYLAAGGTLYVHQLTPETAPQLSKLIGKPVTCKAVPRTDKWWLDPAKIALPRKGSTLTEGIGNFELNWTVFIHLIYGQMKLPDPLIQYTVSSTAAGAQELTEGVFPACALLRVPIGKGQVVVDQVLWDRTPATKEYVAKANLGHGVLVGTSGDVTVSNDGNRRKAGRYISTLMANILTPVGKE